MASADYRYIRSFFTAGQIRRGLGITVLAATVGAVFYTQANALSLVFAGFAKELHVSIPLMAILVATLPLSSVAEIVMAYLIQRTGKRQEFFAYGLIVSRLLWLPIVLIPYAIGEDAYGTRMTVLCALLFLSSVVNVAGGNAWGTWMGDLIPGTVLGRYFGYRQIFTSLAAILVGVLVGKYLDIHHGPGGFLVVVSVLLVFGIADAVLFKWVPHPPMRARAERHTLWDMVRIPLADRGYRNVIILFAVWNFTANLIGPYIGIFQLWPEYAAMSYTRSNVYAAIGAGCMVVTSYYWGRLGDRWDRKKVLTICLVLASVPPLFYLFVTPEVTWPILVANILGNVGWGGVFVVSMQLIIGCAPAKDRSMYLACQSAILGCVITLSYLAGGAFVKLFSGLAVHVGPYTWRELHFLFLLCGLARFLCLIPLRKIPGKTAE